MVLLSVVLKLQQLGKNQRRGRGSLRWMLMACMPATAAGTTVTHLLMMTWELWVLNSMTRNSNRQHRLLDLKFSIKVN